MLSKHNTRYVELSTDVHDEADWVIGQLRQFDIPYTITSFAVEPTTKLLAIGTSNGAVYIHGGPAVDVKLLTPGSVGVKFLGFASLSQKILCIDDNNVMHVWDLTTFGDPEYLISARFDQVTAFTTSPSLCHVFVGLQTGEVKTYDLACLRKSHYTAPNMWKLYQQSMRVGGMPSLVPQSSSQLCVDQQLHPRDLNQIFVAYSGGVILSNLTERSTIRAYEMTLPPGAPGGFGYGMDDILTHRQPEVTSMSIHPSGHLFAVGHADGCIAFWAVDDDTKPLLVRTLDNENVDQVDNSRLEKELEKNQEGKGTVCIREPIFKLAWSGYSNSSDPRGGETTLTILGGLDSKHGGSITVLLFPAFQPPDPPTTDGEQDPKLLHPFFREEMVKSLTPQNAYIYEGKGEIQDFLLCPREHLHFGGNYDPYAIICLQATPENGRVVEAYRFPPPGWIYPKARPPKVEPSTDQSESPDQTSLDPQMDEEDSEDEGEELDLPFQLVHGSASLESGQLLTVDVSAYDDLVDINSSVVREGLHLEGGQAYNDQSRGEEIRLTKFSPRRIFITCDNRWRLKFFDFSAQLLANVPPEPLKHHFPNPLLGLSVDLGSYTAMTSLLEDRPSVLCFSFAPEALELAIALTDGRVVVFLPSTTKHRPPAEEYQEIIMLNPSAVSSSVFSPRFVVQGDAAVQTCALSDTGFLAISYRDGKVVVVDMRGPRILSKIAARSKHKRVSSLGNRFSSEPDVATALTWSITPTDQDAKLRVRLLVSRAAGSVEIYALLLNGNPAVWTIAEDSVTTKGVSDPLPGGSFVLDSKTGNPRGASRGLFAAAVRLAGGDDAIVPSLFVTVGSRGARVYSNVDGERLGRAEWSSKYGTAVVAQVVERMASKALVVITDAQIGLAYTLPSLEHITDFKMPLVETSVLTVDRSGDFVAFSDSNQGGVVDQLVYGTFFDTRRTRFHPEINFAMKSSSVSQPQPVSIGPASLLGTWLHFNQTYSGRQIDDLLGGPNRPVIVKQAVTGASGPSVAETASSAATSIAASAAAAQATIYSKLTAAMNERGQLLGDLEERFNSLETGSRNMVAQAKRLAAQQTAKSWFGF
ncbi:hypothetical protein CC2G_000608 [Coprinopsis cinerea AmutBmut pab1-1]|nr:hypothetical protein CC2G_000608 [Coprinopsis cinerea AmutBmut pab1-1]